MNLTIKHYLATDSQLAKARLALTVLFPVAALFSTVIWLGTTVHFPTTMILFLAGKEFSNQTSLNKDNHCEINSYYTFIYSQIFKQIGHMDSQSSKATFNISYCKMYNGDLNQSGCLFSAFVQLFNLTFYYSYHKNRCDSLKNSDAPVKFLVVWRHCCSVKTSINALHILQ